MPEKRPSWASTPLALLAAALLVFLLLLFWGTRVILIDSFTEVETRDMYKNMERAIGNLEDELNKLATICTDYSGWDDSYRFVQDGNPEFVESNLTVEVFTNLHLNVMVFTDTSGRIVYGRGFDEQTGQFGKLPAGLLRYLEQNSKLIDLPTPEAQRTGVLNLPEGALLVAARPVLTSQFTGPVQGTLIMGRWLDAAEVARIAEEIRLALTVAPTGSDSLPNGFSAAEKRLLKGERFVLQPQENGNIAAYGLFPDIFGKPALMLRVDTPRSIYQEGKKTITYFMCWFALVGVCIAFAINFFWSKLTQSLLRIERSEERNRLVVERTNQAIVLLAPDHRSILDANPAAIHLFGLPREDLVGTDVRNLFEWSRWEAEENLKRCQQETRELRLHHSDGSLLIAEGNACAIPHGDEQALCLMLHDITDRRRFEDQLLRQATHDILTGLPNRSLLQDRLNQAIEGAKRREQMVALLMFDLDNFKMVNDTLGHTAGDQLLCGVANRIRSFVRSCDTFARLGGDEFVILLTNVQRMDDVMTVAKNFSTLLELPFLIDERELFVTASLGIALFPDDGDTMEILIKKADTAMYHIKESGRNSFQFFTESMNQKVQARLAIETGLRRALQKEEMLLHYQPRQNLKTGNIVGMEALIRWNHPELGLIAPAEFIPIAEDSGLIVEIGDWVLADACRQTLAWHRQGYAFLRVSVNISARQFNLPDFVERSIRIIEQSGLSPRFVELELTESTLTHNMDEAIRTMQQLRRLGISISIDDFGTGYSSLNYLKRFPADFLKIDKSFVDDMVRHSSDAAIVTTIISVAHHMQMKVVAEGVETADQIALLTEGRCEEIQGYYFSRPLPPQEFEAFLHTRSPS